MRIYSRHQTRKRNSKIYQWYPNASLFMGRRRTCLCRYLFVSAQLYPIYPRRCSISWVTASHRYRFRSHHHGMSCPGNRQQSRNRSPHGKIRKFRHEKPQQKYAKTIRYIYLHRHQPHHLWWGFCFFLPDVDKFPHQIHFLPFETGLKKTVLNKAFTQQNREQILYQTP
jgi:hypothetical protein